MGVEIGILIGFCLFLLWEIRELKKQIKNIENHLGKMGHDLNMIVYTQKNSKQILKG